MLDTFRRELQAWLEANCPSSMRTPMPEDEIVWGGTNPSFPSQDARIWLERMAAKGWTVPEWPKEYGGGGLSPEEAQILREEMQHLGCRPPLYSFGIWMLGPVLLRYGTEARRKLFYLRLLALKSAGVKAIVSLMLGPISPIYRHAPSSEATNL
jgi:acyl-CoA dehydrogenase